MQMNFFFFCSPGFIIMPDMLALFYSISYGRAGMKVVENLKNATPTIGIQTRDFLGRNLPRYALRLIVISFQISLFLSHGYSSYDFRHFTFYLTYRSQLTIK